MSDEPKIEISTRSYKGVEFTVEAPIDPQPGGFLNRHVFDLMNPVKLRCSLCGFFTLLDDKGMKQHITKKHAKPLNVSEVPGP